MYGLNYVPVILAYAGIHGQLQYPLSLDSRLRGNDEICALNDEAYALNDGSYRFNVRTYAH